MIPAFWDASAVVLLCVEQRSSPAARQLSRQYDLVIWWSTQVEARSAFERLVRTGQQTIAHHGNAVKRLAGLRQSWREIRPTNVVRSQAEAFVQSYPLKAADAMQLAAAYVWCAGMPAGHVFISGDLQLLEAARQVGFRIQAV